MRTPTHFAVHIQVLQEYLASRNVRFGKPEDLLPFVELLDAQGTFHDEIASLTRAVFYGEDMLLTRMELLDLLCVAVAGLDSKSAEGEVHRAVRQLLVFVNGILLALQGGALKALEDSEASEDSENSEEELPPPAHGASVTAYTSTRPAPKPEPSAPRLLWKEDDAHPEERLRSMAFEEGPNADQLVLATPYPSHEAVPPHPGESVAKSSDKPRSSDAPLAFARVSTQRHTGGVGEGWRSITRLREQKFVSRPALLVGGTAVTVLALLVFVPRHAAPRAARPDSPPPDHQYSEPPTLKPEPLSPQAASVAASSLVSGSAPAVSAQSLLALHPPRDQEVIDISQDAAMRRLVFSPQPEYPLLAKMTDVGGQVALEVIISPQGSVESTLVLQGQGLLRGAAEDAVRRWQFRPYLEAGRPTAVQTTVVVNFQREPSGKINR